MAFKENDSVNNNNVSQNSSNTAEFQAPVVVNEIEHQTISDAQLNEPDTRRAGSQDRLLERASQLRFTPAAIAAVAYYKCPNELASFRSKLASNLGFKATDDLVQPFANGRNSNTFSLVGMLTSKLRSSNLSSLSKILDSALGKIIAYKSSQECTWTMKKSDVKICLICTALFGIDAADSYLNAALVYVKNVRSSKGEDLAYYDIDPSSMAEMIADLMGASELQKSMVIAGLNSFLG